MIDSCADEEVPLEYPPSSTAGSRRRKSRLQGSSPRPGPRSGWNTARPDRGARGQRLAAGAQVQVDQAVDADPWERARRGSTSENKASARRAAPAWTRCVWRMRRADLAGIHLHGDRRGWSIAILRQGGVAISRQPPPYIKPAANEIFLAPRTFPRMLTRSFPAARGFSAPIQAASADPPTGRSVPPEGEAADPFRERTLRAVRIVLQAEILVDLEQALLVGGGSSTRDRTGRLRSRTTAAPRWPRADCSAIRPAAFS